MRLAIVLATLACIVVPGIGPAAASPRYGPDIPVSTVTKKIGLAGYYFRVGKTTHTLKVHGNIRVPTSTCGQRTRYYQLQAGAGFRRHTRALDAIVVLLLKCKAGAQPTGQAQLVVGYHAKMPARPIAAGELIRIRVTVRRSRAVARIVYPNGTSDSVSGGGGRPDGGVYALTLPRYDPPQYSVVRFSRCTVNSRSLAAFKPGIWESVTGSGRVDGVVSALTGGTAFTISRPSPPGGLIW